MAPPAGPAGMAFLCDTQGRIVNMMRDELGVGSGFAAERFFPAAVDPVSTLKALSFLEEIRTHGAAFNWTLNCAIGGAIVPLHFAGGTDSNGTIVVVGARSHADIMELYDDLMQINNEQVNALRTAMKEVASGRNRLNADAHLYDELSRLNNELTTTQRELARKNAELARLNEQKNQFLGIAAHDLRTPLGAIMIYSEFLMESLPDRLQGEEADFLATIHTTSHYMLSLVNDLLDIVKIEAGTLDLDLEPHDLVRIIRRTISLNRVFAEKKKITLVFDEPEGPTPILMMDAPKLEQVFNNLIGNAIKFSHPDSAIRIGMVVDKERVEIAVADKGVGIPAGELEQLFLPFRTASTRSTAGERGAGLGLAIARKIVRGHRGTITVESTPGTGSTFTVVLPVDMSARGIAPRT
ncbi:MAG: histidine kinase [Chlorobi bacterium]|nr:histidine kinase [Chlorobiota bacterium]